MIVASATNEDVHDVTDEDHDHEHLEHDHEHHDQEDEHLEKNEVGLWLASVGSIIAISLCGVFGVLVIPIMQKVSDFLSFLLNEKFLDNF